MLNWSCSPHHTPPHLVHFCDSFICFSWIALKTPHAVQASGRPTSSGLAEDLSDRHRIWIWNFYLFIYLFIHSLYGRTFMQSSWPGFVRSLAAYSSSTGPFPDGIVPAKRRFLFNFFGRVFPGTPKNSLSRSNGCLHIGFGVPVVHRSSLSGVPWIRDER